MKSYKIALALVGALIAASCSGPKANIAGTIEGASQKEVIVKLLDVSTFTVLDTIKTDAAGRFSCSVDIQEGQPEFVYLFYGDKSIASLLLAAGDNVTVTADTLGSCTVDGSEESVLLQANEKAFASFLKQMGSAASSPERTKAYVQYYREAVKYVMTHPYSLTVVPVLFQNINPDFPVFSQTTDALHFRAAADSLKTVFPESRYVKALETEAQRREQILSLDTQMSMASMAGYPDIKSRDVNGNEVSLSAVDAKAIIVQFWTVTDASSKIVNLDSLKPIYERFHDRGLEIFQVSLDTDKAAWANVVKSQDIPWISVNDGLGSSSPVVLLYNVTSLPQSYLIVNGELYDKVVKGDAALIKELEKALK